MSQTNAVRDDAAWRRAAQKWIDTNAAAESAEAEAKKARAKLVALAGDASAEGAGVRVAYYFQGGGIDYGRIPELSGLDLDPYRKSGGWRHKVSAQ